MPKIISCDICNNKEKRIYDVTEKFQISTNSIILMIKQGHSHMKEGWEENYLCGECLRKKIKKIFKDDDYIIN